MDAKVSPKLFVSPTQVFSAPYPGSVIISPRDFWQPIRPFRALPALADDKAVSKKQALHHRGQSVGNLKAMTDIGTLNAASKRAAFGDVSNTGKAVHVGAKDVGKARVTTTNQYSTVTDKENNDAAWANRHEGWNRAGPQKVSTQVPKRATVNIATVSSAAPSAFAKPAVKSTAVPLKRANWLAYHDPLEVAEPRLMPDIAASVDDSAAQMPKQIPNPRHYKSQPLLKTHQAAMHRPAPVQPMKKSLLFKGEEDVTEPSSEDAVELQAKDPNTVNRITRLHHPARLGDVNEISEPVQKQVLRVGHEMAQAAARPASLACSALTVDEAEEPWDDEEQDLYDEPGYSTAHSYREYGQNTTVVTTVVAPKGDATVRQELELARVWVMDHQNEDEIEEEMWDVSMVAEYGDEIFDYIRNLETKMLPNPSYMNIQTEIQWTMRAVLMDWLVQVHLRFGLLPETLFLAVNYIDRFLSVKVVSISKLQLVGATALFLAAKYEEINCPSVQEIVFMVDEGYSAEEILKAERFMLGMLQFELGWPGPMSFLRRISKADEYDLETRTLAKYLLEVTIMDERFVSTPASYSAAGAHCLARLVLGRGVWTLAHVHYSGYTLAQLKPLIHLIWECCQSPADHHQAIFAKYGGKKFKSVAIIVETAVKQGFSLAQALSAPHGGNRMFFERGVPLGYDSVGMGHPSEGI